MTIIATQEYILQPVQFDRFQFQSQFDRFQFQSQFDRGFRTRCGVTTSTSFEVGDLENGREYGFSVIAVNEVGESDPIQTAKTMVAKDQFSKYPFFI
jgi:hypothetical protein